jgi:hypothetical protein
MNRSLLLLATTAAMSALASVAPHAAVLTADVFDDGTLIDTVTSSSGALTLNSTDAAFSLINVDATGAPLIPGGDLSTITLNVKNVSAGSRTLTVDVFQTGLTVPANGTLSSFTVNDLVGAGNIGPTTESTFANGTSSSLGTLLATHTFPTGTTSGEFGPVSAGAGALFADAHQYIIPFTGPGSANDSIELTTGVPEPSTWVMLGMGFAGLAALGWRKRKPAQLELI